MHVEEAKRVLGSEIAWIADNMANELKHALGNRQNSEYLVDPKGRILRVRAWSDPDQLRRDLAEFVGSVENPTEVSDLNMTIRPAPEHAQTGVVPRIEKPGTYRTLVSRPQLAKTDEPFYTKLRAEADQDLLRSGEGKLYPGLPSRPASRGALEQLGAGDGRGTLCPRGSEDHSGEAAGTEGQRRCRCRPARIPLFT